MPPMYSRPDTSTDRFDPNPERSFTMPASLYTDPDVFRREQERIFWNSWMRIGHASDVRDRGQYLTADIAGQRIFALRTAEGELKAFFNVCMHRGHALLEGQGTVTSRITCPYHAWAYDTDGVLKGARMSDRMTDFDFDDFQLPAVAIEEFYGFVFVNLSPDPTPMTEAYPGLEAALREVYDDPASLEKSVSTTFTIAANWKNVADNLLECYHCHPAHPAFVELIDMDTYRNETYTNWSIQSGSSRPENSTYDVAPTGVQSFTSAYMWPNVSFGRLPGTKGILVFEFVPTAAEETMQTVTFYAPAGGESEQAMASFAYFSDVLGPEDVALVESVQVGLRSLGYHQGRFICIPDRPEISEHAVHHFHAMVLDALA